MAPAKLFYFPIPGRGETTRMLFNYGGIEFTEELITFEEWGKDWKDKMADQAYGQLPILEVDGKTLSQSGAMERYVARLAGVYPSDDWEAAKVEEAVGIIQDAFNAMINATNSKMSPEEKIAARKAAVDGPLKVVLQNIIKMLLRAGGEFITGASVTYADFALFSVLSILSSGFLDGVSTDIMDAYPELKSFHERFAALPAIAKMYESASGLRATFKELPAAPLASTA